MDGRRRRNIESSNCNRAPSANSSRCGWNLGQTPGLRRGPSGTPGPSGLSKTARRGGATQFFRELNDEIVPTGVGRVRRRDGKRILAGYRGIVLK